MTLVQVLRENRDTIRSAVMVGPPKAFMETLHSNLLPRVIVSASLTSSTVIQSLETSPTLHGAVLLWTL